MRRLSAVIMGVSLVILPGIALAQQQTCEQRTAILGQLVEDMSRQRAVVSTAEIEAASLKIQVKELLAVAVQAKRDAEKPKEEKK